MDLPFILWRFKMFKKTSFIHDEKKQKWNMLLFDLIFFEDGTENYVKFHLLKQFWLNKMFTVNDMAFVISWNPGVVAILEF